MCKTSALENNKLLLQAKDGLWFGLVAIEEGEGYYE